ncbi:WD domain containing [Cordyceps militaris]|uniref:WD domain containing n=1 Tax=Cordyceps militaris TaxID=73501 RepID=A0A2H4S8K5_CORMI|nr:WD domain containing [Cordyceps militaris]
MAGQRISRVKVDKTKKRKRDSHENEVKAKRARPQDANGELAEPTSTKDLAERLDRADASWKISKPMGGRMLDIDPILTDNGDSSRYLILTYNTSIQVFSATDSLLVRRIPVSSIDASAPQASTPAPIVATRLSKLDANFVWVACADGQVYRINWTKESKSLESFQTASKTARAMSIVPFGAKNRPKETVIVAESNKSTRIELVAYEWDQASTPKSKSLVFLKRPGTGLQLLECTKDGQYLVGAINDRLFLGVSQQLPAKSDKLQYDFYSFDTPDLITTLDLRAYKRSSKHIRSETEKVVDVIVGGARGGIYLYHDAISRCQATESCKTGDINIQAQKFHWHRKAVHSVKWSKDGNYMISGGSENTLVMWQMDTSKKDFLPHLSGSVENIVVSPDGTSYVVHLDDNSAMIVSTSEMKPSAYVSGIQSAAANIQTPKDQLVKRVWEIQDHVRERIPAAIRSNAPSRLHVCVGTGRQSTMSGRFSAPLLQAFDLDTFTSVSKQALARTQPTDINMTNKGHVIDEPLVTHVEFSGDGKWLASVDDWQPAARDIDNVSSELREQFTRERREVYLKFWEVQDDNEPVALVSRINGPHASSSSEPVLDLASDPTSTCFATIGGDGLVRLWRPRTRHVNGIVSKGAGGKETVSWGCAQVIPVGEGYGAGALTDVAAPSAPQGKITYSEDGSTIFAAFGFSDSGSVYVIDAASGKVIRILEGLWEGNLHAIRTLSPFVVILSDVLYVYDIVSDELRYGIVVPQIPGVEGLLQLAVDKLSGHFAVTLPIDKFSSIGIFSPEDPEPLMVRSTPHRIVSLTTAPGTSGFLALDDAAQIWTVTEGSDPSSIVTAQPLQDIHLEGQVDDGANGDVAAAAEDDVLMASDDEEAAADHVADDDMDMDIDDVPTSVISQQSLSDIFNAAPAFAGPSVEDMFYKVTGLLGTKPLPS